MKVFQIKYLDGIRVINLENINAIEQEGNIARIFFNNNSIYLVECEDREKTTQCIENMFTYMGKK